MRFKRLLALLLAAALALSLLAGCGGGSNQSLSQVLLNLLDGQYQNVSVETDQDLESKLRQAINESDTDDEIRQALERLLGSGINFQMLGSGQQGDSAWNLIIYPGTDPDAAARSAFVEWNKVFSVLPGDGQYSSGLAMVETENGYAILVKATVDKAGSQDHGNNDEPDKPEEAKEPYEVTIDSTTGNITAVTVNTSEALNQIFSGTVASGDPEEENALEAARTEGFDGVTIILAAGKTYTVNTSTQSLAKSFKGTLTSTRGKATIELKDGGALFEKIESGSIVENIIFDVQKDISNSYIYVNFANTRTVYAGAVAGQNNGIITGCIVNLGSHTITAENVNGIAYAGGIAGCNTTTGEITECVVNGGTIVCQSQDNTAYAGGIVGSNLKRIADCTVTDAAIRAEGNFRAYVGGIGGWNSFTGTIEGSCEVKGNTSIYAEGTSSMAYAGGIAAYNSSKGIVGNSCSWTGSKIEAKAMNGSGSYDIAAVPDGDNDSGIDRVGNAYAGTGIGYDESRGNKPISVGELNGTTGNDG